MRFEIFSPSFRRASLATTQRYLPECRYVVAKSEGKAYRSAGHDIIEVPNRVQGNVSRVRNWILDHATTKAVLILDDDLRSLGFWKQQTRFRMAPGQAMEFIERGFCLAAEVGARMWGLNLLPDKGAYREYTPFGLKQMILGPFQGFYGMDLRYDEALPLKEDYDLSLQCLNKYRRTLRFNAYHYECDQHTGEGGCATYRTMETEREQFDLLQKKWGSKIVKVDNQGGQVNQTKQTNWDINPVVRAPIAGV